MRLPPLVETARSHNRQSVIAAIARTAVRALPHPFHMACRAPSRPARRHCTTVIEKGSTMRLVALFNLKPGIDPQAYAEWARTVDLPTVNGLSSISSFRVFKATGLLGSDAAPPYGYVEIIDVADMDQFGKDVATEVMQKVAAQFNDMV